LHVIFSFFEKITWFVINAKLGKTYD